MPDPVARRSARKMTLKDVAREVGLHPSTISRALDPDRYTLVSDATRSRVHEAADALGYRVDAVASGLRRGRTNTLGVVVANLENPFIAPVVRGLENGLDEQGAMALIAETKDESGRLRGILEHLLERRVDGVVVAAAREGDEELLLAVADRVPVILAVRDLPGSGLAAVTFDDRASGRLVAEHLIGLGHRQVAQLAGPVEISSFAQRSEGFEQFVAEAGGVLLGRGITGAPSIDSGERLMTALLAAAGPAPTAVFAHNDLMALGAYRALARAGLRCPADVSIVGHNDSVMSAYLTPALTTISLPGYAIGQAAARLARAAIRSQSEDREQVVLAPELQIRASTGPGPVL